jgi:two-component system phosphate regulon response regulator PhoB
MAELKTRILVVDDDQRLRDLLVRYLGGEGHEVKAVPDAAAMDKQLARERYDLVVLDLMLPGEDGLAICRRLRAQDTAPAIIMLTAKGDDVDRIVGLEMGADDYLPKPFNPKELLARIKAVLRRRAPQLSGDAIEREGLRLDPASHRVTAGDQRLALSPAEFRLLHFLLTHPGRVYSRAQLLDQVWGDHVYIEERTVDVHIRRLRKALEPSGHDRLIDTVRGAGYGLRTA